MNRVTLSFLIALFIISACANINKVDLKLSWAFESYEDAEFITRTKIYLIQNENKNFIAEAEGNFSEVSRNLYAQELIPDDAIIACSGFWAGLQKTFYVVLKNKQLEIYEGQFDSEGDAPRTFSKFNVLEIR